MASHEQCENDGPSLPQQRIPVSPSLPCAGRCSAGAFLGGYLIAGLVFLAALGFFGASVAYGLLISIHATSIVCLDSLLVNGKPFPLAPHMPREGKFVVPQKVWFVWPNLGIIRRGGIAESDISAFLQRTAMVSQNQIIGRAFKHWFGRRQWP